MEGQALLPLKRGNFGRVTADEETDPPPAKVRCSHSLLNR